MRFMPRGDAEEGHPHSEDKPACPVNAKHFTGPAGMGKLQRQDPER